MMLNATGLTDELRILKGELSRLLTAKSADSCSESHADVLAGQIKAALNELSATLHEQGDHAEKLISDRPITTLASAFALGVVIGFMMRQH
jgi:ElaB/YqjD/DUF883 family membrane-anchored ribosome-binding protein